MFCAKFVLYLAFILVQTFEIEVLCLFMLSQKPVRVEQLEMVRPRYNRYEMWLWILTKVRIYLAILFQVYVVVIILVPSTNFYYVVMVQGGFMFFTLILSLQEYFCASSSRISLMYRLHRYEYKLHAYNLIGLQCANLFSIAYSVLGFYSVTLISSCVLSEQSYTNHT